MQSREEFDGQSFGGMEKFCYLDYFLQKLGYKKEQSSSILPRII